MIKSDIKIIINDKAITYNHGILIENLVRQQLTTYSSDDVCDFLKSSKKILLGSNDNEKGYVGNYIYPEIERLVNESEEDIYESLKLSVKSKIEELKMIALKKFIPGNELFEQNKNKLKTFKEHVESLSINI